MKKLVQKNFGLFVFVIAALLFNTNVKSQTLTVSGTNLAPSQAITNQQNVAMLQLTLISSVGIINVSSIKVDEIGTINADTDIIQVYLYDDQNGDGTIGGGEPVIGAQSFAGQSATFALAGYNVSAGVPRSIIAAVWVSSTATLASNIKLRLVNSTYVNCAPASTNFTTTPIDSNATTVVGRLFVSAGVNLASATTIKNKEIAVLKFPVNSQSGTLTLNNLTITRTGTGVDSDVAAGGVRLYEDTDSSGTLTGGDTLLKSGTLSSGGVTLSAIGYSITNVAKTLIIAYQISSTAPGGNTLGAKVNAYTDVTLTAGVVENANFPLSSNNSTITNQTVTVTAANQMPSKIFKNQKKITTQTLNYSLNIGTATIDTIKVDRTGTGADADISTVALYDDANGDNVATSGELIASSTFSSGTKAFTSLGIGLTTAGKKIIVVYDIANTATYYVTVGSQLVNSSYTSISFAASDGATTSFTSPPFSSTNAEIYKRVLAKGVISGGVVKPANIIRGQNNVLMAKLNLSVETGGGNALFVLLKVDKLGTGSDSGISKVILYDDTNDDGLIDGGDAILSSGSFSGGTATLVISSPFIISEGTPENFLIALNISNTATAGQTYGIKIADNSYVGITGGFLVADFNSTLDANILAGVNSFTVKNAGAFRANDELVLGAGTANEERVSVTSVVGNLISLSAITSYPHNSGDTVQIALPLENMAPLSKVISTVVITPYSLAPTKVARGEKNVVVEKLLFSIDSGTSTFNGIKVERLGTGIDTDVSKITIWSDFNNNGSPDESTSGCPTTSCPILVQGTYGAPDPAGTKVFSGFTFTAQAGTNSSMLILYDVSSGSTTTTTLGVKVTKEYFSGCDVFTNCNFAILDTDGDMMSNSGFPVFSNLFSISRKIYVNASSVDVDLTGKGWKDIAPLGANPGQTNVPMLVVEFVNDASAAQSATINSIKVDMQGSASNTDILAVKLYEDFNKNKIIDGPDIQLASGTFDATRSKNFTSLNGGAGWNISDGVGNSKYLLVGFDISGNSNTDVTVGAALENYTYLSADSNTLVWEYSYEDSITDGGTAGNSSLAVNDGTKFRVNDIVDVGYGQTTKERKTICSGASCIQGNTLTFTTALNNSHSLTEKVEKVAYPIKNYNTDTGDITLTTISSIVTIQGKSIVKERDGSDNICKYPSQVITPTGDYECSEQGEETAPILQLVARIYGDGDGVLSVDANSGSNSITLTDATNFNIGNEIILSPATNKEERKRISNKVGNVLTLDSSLSYTHLSGSASEKIIKELANNGSAQIGNITLTHTGAGSINDISLGNTTLNVAANISDTSVTVNDPKNFHVGRKIYFELSTPANYEENMISSISGNVINLTSALTKAHIINSAVSGGAVRIFFDANNNGILDSGEPMAAYMDVGLPTQNFASAYAQVLAGMDTSWLVVYAIGDYADTANPTDSHGVSLANGDITMSSNDGITFLTSPITSNSTKVKGNNLIVDSTSLAPSDIAQGTNTVKMLRLQLSTTIGNEVLNSITINRSGTSATLNGNVNNVAIYDDANGDGQVTPAELLANGGPGANSITFGGLNYTISSSSSRYIIVTYNFINPAADLNSTIGARVRLDTGTCDIAVDAPDSVKGCVDNAPAYYVSSANTTIRNYNTLNVTATPLASSHIPTGTTTTSGMLQIKFETLSGSATVENIKIRGLAIDGTGSAAGLLANDLVGGGNSVLLYDDANGDRLATAGEEPPLGSADFPGGCNPIGDTSPCEITFNINPFVVTAGTPRYLLLQYKFSATAIAGDRLSAELTDTSYVTVTAPDQLKGFTTTLSGAHSAGSNTITVGSVSGFSAGETITIEPGVANIGNNGKELIRISGLDPVANPIPLQTPLGYNHSNAVSVTNFNHSSGWAQIGGNEIQVVGTALLNTSDTIAQGETKALELLKFTPSAGDPLPPPITISSITVNRTGIQSSNFDNMATVYFYKDTGNQTFNVSEDTLKATATFSGAQATLSGINLIINSDADGSTTTSGTSNSGQKNLTVTSSNKFTPGKKILIGPPYTEDAIVGSIIDATTIQLSTDLINTHGGGASVKELSTPQYGFLVYKLDSNANIKLATLTVQANVGSTSITVDSSANITAGDNIILGSGATEESNVVAGIAGNVVSLQSSTSYIHNINEGVLGTLGVKINNGNNNSPIVVDSGNTVRYAASPTASNNIKLKANSVVVSAANRLPAKVIPGSTIPVMNLNFSLNPDQGGATVSSIKVNKSGLSAIDNDVSLAKLYTDTNANGIVDGSDSLLTSGNFASGTLTFSGLNVSVTAGSTTSLLLVYDISSYGGEYSAANSLSGNAFAGTNAITLNNSANFTIGEDVLISVGLASQERKKIQNIVGNTLTLTTNLTNNHLTSEEVKESAGTSSIDVGATLTSKSFITLSGDDTVAATNFPLSSNTTIMRDILTVTATDKAPSIVSQGQTGVEMMKLNLAASSNNITLTSLKLSQSGTAVDSDTSLVSVYDDVNNDGFANAGDTLITSGTFSSGTKTFSGLAYTISSTSSKNLLVVYDISATANTSSTTGVSIASANYFTLNSPDEVSASVPFNSLTSVIYANDTLVVTGTSLAPSVVPPGTLKVVMEKLNLAPQSGSITISTMKVDESGSSTDDTDVSTAYLYEDVNSSNTIDGGDVLLASAGVVSQQITFSGIAYTVTYDAPKNVLIAYDISSAAGLTKTVQAKLTSISNVTVVAPDDVSTSTFPMYSSASTILQADTLNVSFTDSAPANVVQGQSNVPMAKLSLTAVTNSVNISSIKVEESGDASYTDVEKVLLYNDIAGNGIIDGGDSILASGSFNSSKNITFTLSNYSVTSGTPKYIIIAYNFSGTAVVGKVVGVKMSSSSNINVVTPDMLGGIVFPQQTASSIINESPDVLSLSGTNLTSGSIYQGQANAQLEKLTLSVASGSVTVTSLKVDKSGTMADAEITSLRLYNDSNNNGYDVSDTLLATAGFSSGSATFGGLSYTITTATNKNLVVTANISATATVGNTISIGVAGNTYLTLVSGLDSVSGAGFPINSNTATVTVPPDILTLTGTNKAPTTLLQGQSAVVMEKLTLSVDKNSINITALKVKNSGSSADSDISSIKLYEDVDNSGTLGGSDTLLGSSTFSSGVANINGLNFTTNSGAANNKYLLVVYDVSATAQTAVTTGAELTDITYITVAAGDEVSTTNFPISSGQPTIGGNTLTVTSTNSAPTTVDPAGTYIMQKLTLSADSGSVTVNAVKIKKTGTSTSDSDVSSVKLYEDVDNSNSVNGGDNLLGSGTFSSGVINITGLSLAVTSGTNKNLLITYDIAISATTGATVGSELTDSTYITVNVPDAVSTSGFPLSSSNSQIRDNVAPAQITNLAAVQGTGSGEVNLSWTATGDDGSSGAATSYTIKYSTSTITSGNFDSATSVTTTPAPQVAGLNETLTVTGLTPGVTYYFAIKATDDAANSSTISNVTNAVAPDRTPPTLNHTATLIYPYKTEFISPLTIFATVTDDVAVQSVTLYYKKRSDISFTSLAMTGTGANYSAQIPNAIFNNSGIDYYISASDTSNNVSTYPTTNPSTSPQQIQPFLTLVSADNVNPKNILISVIQLQNGMASPVLKIAQDSTSTVNITKVDSSDTTAPIYFSATYTLRTSASGTAQVLVDDYLVKNITFVSVKAKTQTLVSSTDVKLNLQFNENSLLNDSTALIMKTSQLDENLYKTLKGKENINENSFVLKKENEKDIYYLSDVYFVGLENKNINEGIDISLAYNKENLGDLSANKLGIYNFNVTKNKWIYKQSLVNESNTSSKISSLGNYILILDNAIPVVEKTSVKDGEFVYTLMPQLSAKVSDLGSGIADNGLILKIDGKELNKKYDEDSGNINLVLESALAGGKHKLTIEAIDRVGNKSQIKEINFNSPDGLKLGRVLTLPNPISNFGSKGKGGAKLLYNLNLEDAIVSVEIYSTSGKSIAKFDGTIGRMKVRMLDESLEFSLPIQSIEILPNGVYFVRVVAQDLISDKKAQKVIKMVILK